MKKPKVGDKYIIEIDSHMTNKHGNLYGVKGFRSLVFDQNGLDRLTPYDADSAYAEGYTLAESKFREVRDRLKQEAYQRGLDDAWDALKKWCSLLNKDRIEIFGMKRTKEMVKRFRPDALKQLIEGSKAQEDKLKVGDIIKFTGDGTEAMVIEVQDDEFSALGADGKVNFVRGENLYTKTGRHVDLIKLIRGEEECISRKEVIDAIEKFVDSFDLDDWSQEQLGALVHDIETLNALPSEQPERRSIELNNRGVLN